jgi:Leucine-rich repeat (LRR) protein
MIKPIFFIQDAEHTIQDAKSKGVVQLSLEGFKLTTIPNTIKDLTNLKKLDLGNNQINDISFLKDLTQLTALRLSDNPIQDISVLKNLTQLTHLYLSGNQIQDISALQNLTQLTHLVLSYNQISDIGVLENLRSLEQLALGGNPITDFSCLKYLKQLTHLHLQRNTIRNISFLKDLTQLIKLDLGNNQINDISFLENLTELKHLDLAENRIRSITVLKNLTQLTHLRLGYNQINDISVLKDLISLAKLYLAHTHTKEPSFLKDLTQLTYVDLRGNPMSDISVGFIANQLGRFVVFSHIYNRLIINQMSSKMVYSQLAKPLGLGIDYQNRDGNLNMEAVLLGFQSFMKREYDYKERLFLEKKGALVFSVFLKSIMNGAHYAFQTPKISKEKHFNITITHNKNAYITQFKTWRGAKLHEKGLLYLASYLESQQLTEGYLIILKYDKIKNWATHRTVVLNKRIFIVWV